MREALGPGEIDNLGLVRTVYEEWGERSLGVLSVPAANGLAARVSQITGRRINGGQVRHWLTHPQEWSPYPDVVAIERALDFDWDVVQRLTRLEVSLVVQALADADDPWSTEEPDSWRAYCWEHGPQEDRRYLLNKVMEARWERHIRECVGC